jgi:hypothetical protein
MQIEQHPCRDGAAALCTGVLSEFAIAHTITSRFPCKLHTSTHVRLASESWSLATKSSNSDLKGCPRKGGVPVRRSFETGEHGRVTRRFPVRWTRRPWNHGSHCCGLPQLHTKRLPRIALPDACELHAWGAQEWLLRVWMRSGRCGSGFVSLACISSASFLLCLLARGSKRAQTYLDGRLKSARQNVGSAFGACQPPQAQFICPELLP